MNRPLIVSIAAAGLIGLAAVAYFANRPAAGNPAPTAAAAGAAGAKPGAPAGSPAMAVEMAKATAMRIDDEIAAVGTLKSVDSVVLRPETAGRVAAIRFADGERVKKGELLIELDAATQAAELQQARANLGLAQTNLKRSEELFERKFVAQRSLDEAEAQLKVQEAAVALAEARLGKMRLRAPFDGIVGLRSVSVGDFVKDGQEMVNFEGVRTLKVDFRLPESNLPRLARGQRVEVVSDALPNRSFTATVDAIDPLVDTGGRSLALRAVLANADGALRPGMFVRVRLLFGSRERVLMVPEQALVTAAQGQAVFVVVDGKVKQVPVKLGIRRAGSVEVAEGLRDGDTVVTAGQLKLRDGAAVRPVGESGAPATGGMAAASATATTVTPAAGQGK